MTLFMAVCFSNRTKKMKIHFDTLKFSRTRITELIEGLTIEQLNRIPEGHKQNIIWGIGHILATQQLFLYKRTGSPFTLKPEIIMRYKSGSTPEGNVSAEETEYLRSRLFTTLEQVEQDYGNGKFKQFESFVTKRGVSINTVEDAIAFHTFHEGVHLGWIWMLRKAIT